MARYRLGAALAVRGAFVKLALAAATLVALGFVAIAVWLAYEGDREAMPSVVVLTSSVLAWGTGTIAAVAASARALRRDREDGAARIFRAHGASEEEYLVARIVGLGLVLAAIASGGALVVGIVATALSGSEAGSVVRATAGALAYGVGFGVVVGPLAIAALGARARGGGLAWLIAIALLPELGASATGIAREWAEVASVPSALAALRSAVVEGGHAWSTAGRAVVVLAIVTAASIAIARAELAWLDRRNPDEWGRA